MSMWYAFRSRKKNILPVSAVIALVCFFCVFGYAEEHSELTKLADGVYARIVSPDGNAVSNSGIVVLAHCALIFDSHFTPEAGRDLLEAVDSITSKPLRYIVNSHSHPDHTHGNQVFPQAQIIGSTEARREIIENDLPLLLRTMEVTQAQLEALRKKLDAEESGVDREKQLLEVEALERNSRTMSRLKIEPPIITFDDSLKIQDGDREVRLSFLGVGHTGGDIVLYLPWLKIVFTGDLFFESAIPNVQDAHILQWMKTLEKVLQIDAEQFVPGHGKPGSKKDIAAFLTYFRDLKSMIKPAVDRGDSLEQVLKDIRVPAKYSSYRFQRFFPANVQKMYEELKEMQLSTAPPGKSAEE
jgi:cyclase